MVRRTLRDACTAEYLNDPANMPQHVNVNATYAPMRKTCRDPHASEVLPVVTTPCVSDFDIIEATTFVEIASPEDMMIHLRDQRATIDDLLGHLVRAATIAKSVEELHAAESLDHIRGMFLQDYNDLLDPAGVDLRLRDNRRVEEDFIASQTESLGYLLAYNRVEFRIRLQSSATDHDSVRQLLEIANELDVAMSSQASSHDWRLCMVEEVLWEVVSLFRRCIIETEFLLHVQ